MKKTELIILADYAEAEALTFEELCELCQSSPEFIQDLISYEIIQPQDEADMLFNIQQLIRVKTATRLQRDLEMNIPSIAIVLDLLEEMEELRKRMAILEKHMMK